MRSVMIFLLKVYRGLVSPLLGNNCRFYPSCSRYSEEAFGRFDFLKAAKLSLVRLVRCQPFSRGGFDPLPANHEKEIRK